jgi:hypothetical protein
MRLKRTECLRDRINVPETNCENKNVSISAYVDVKKFKKIYSNISYSHGKDEKDIPLEDIHTVLSTWRNYLKYFKCTQLNR